MLIRINLFYVEHTQLDSPEAKLELCFSIHILFGQYSTPLDEKQSRNKTTF